ncbi:MAG: ABC transporter permease [Parvibaculaceae bacterium]
MRISTHGLSLLAKIGIAIVVANILIALAAPLIAPFGEADMVGEAWAPADSTYWLGLDNLGRDIFSRLVYGARLSIGLTAGATILSFAIGVTAGFISAAVGGWLDMLMSRIADLMLSMPTLIFAFVILSVLGTDIPVLVLTVALLNSPSVFRLSRAIAGEIVNLDYVEAARIRGEGIFWIISKEILPNGMYPLVAEFGVRFCFTFLLVAALSFLGLGIQPPLADWGSMVKEYGGMITLDSPAPLYPAAAIALLTIGINLIVDWILSTHLHGYEENAQP